MLGYEWDLSFLPNYYALILKGIAVTIAYAVGTTALGIVIGTFAGIAMLSRSRIVVAIVDAYVQIFRCTPLLMQIIWFYYALPVLLNVNLPAWLAAGLGLTLYMGAFCAEIVRAGIMSIERGQWQAARALGMTTVQMMRRIILPQAARRMVPPFVSQSVLQLKNTSLLYIVAVPDIMYTGSLMASNTFRPVEVCTVIPVVYFIILYPLQKFAKSMESRDDA